jgi:hypothetical protein
LGFSQNELSSDHDQELHLEGVCSDPKSLSTHKPISNSTHIKRTQRFSTKAQEKGKGETKNIRLHKFQQGCKTEIEK